MKSEVIICIWIYLVLFSYDVWSWGFDFVCCLGFFVLGGGCLGFFGLGGFVRESLIAEEKP